MNTRIEHKCPLSKNAHIYTPTPHPHPHPRVYDIIYHAFQGSCNFWVLINEIEIDVFSTKVLIEDTILSLLLETGPPFYVVIRATRIKVWPFAGLRQSTGLSIGLVPGIEPGSSRSTGKRSSDLTEIFFFWTKAYRLIDRGHYLLYFNLSTSPLESFFDSPQDLCQFQRSRWRENVFHSIIFYTAKYAWFAGYLLSQSDTWMWCLSDWFPLSL